MKVSRRDLLQGASAIALVAGLPSEKAEALLHRAGGIIAPTGKNQVGLNGIAYYNNIKPFTNWLNSAAFSSLTLVQAVASITQTGGLATITTTAPHQLGIGLSTQSGWTLTVAGCTQTGYNLSTAGGFTVTGPNTITYAVNPATVSPATTSTSITFSVQLTNTPSTAQGNPNSVYSALSDTTFLTADGYPQANLSNVTSMTISWIWHALNGTSYQPIGYSRAGQRMECNWVGNSAGVASGPGVSWSSLGAGSYTLTWTSGMETGSSNQFLNMTIPNPADVPTSVYLGLSDGTRNPASDNYQRWLNGTYWDQAYIDMLKPIAGVLRFMDQMNTNANYAYIYKNSDIAATSVQAWGQPSSAMPTAALCQLANLTNKHPYINIPWNLGQPTGFQAQNIKLISKSAPGSNAVITFGYAHPFTTGDTVIPLLVGGGGAFNAGYGYLSGSTFTGSIAGRALTQTSATNFAKLEIGSTITGAGVTAGTVITGGSEPNWTVNNSQTVGPITFTSQNLSANVASNYMTLVGASVATGQNVYFTGSGLLGLNNAQSYYMTQIGTNGVGTFQLATTLAKALAGTVDITLSGVPNLSATMQINRNAFVVGATTTFTIELLHCDTSNFGFQDACTISNGANATITDPLKAVANNTPFYLNGASLATGTNNSTLYYATSSGSPAGTPFTFSTSLGGPNVTTSSTGSGFCVTSIPTTGNVVYPVNLTSMTTEITAYVTDIKNRLNPGLVPNFEYGNEMWNSFSFNGFAWSSAQAHNFPVGSVPAFTGDNNNAMTGYLAAHVFKTIRDVYGGGASGPHSTAWRGCYMGQAQVSTAAAATVNLMLVGTDYYLANFAPAAGLTRNDLITSVGVANYYGSGIGGAVNGGSASGWGTVNMTNVTISATSPATVTLSTGTMSLPIGTPIIFTSNGVLPNDLATGQPLGLGNGSPLVTGISGYFVGPVFNCTAGSGLAVGMTIWGNMTPGQAGTAFVNGAIAMGGVYPAVIQSLGTGTGGVGSYNMSFSQTVGSVGTPIVSMSAQDMKKNHTVYYTTSTGNGFTFSSTVGGANINCDPANPGSGTQNCQTGVSTMMCDWMNQSVAANLSNPATYPSRYTLWNTLFNNNYLGALAQTMTPQSRAGKVASDYWLPTATIAVKTNAFGGVNQPFVFEMQAYEGAWNNGMNGTAPNGVAMLSSPMFQEFYPTAIGTTEDAAIYTSNVNEWYNLPTYGVSQGVANAAAIKPVYPAKFVDAINPSYTFSFGALSVVDHYQGIAWPTWQAQSFGGSTATNSHVLYDAVAATN